MDIPIKESHALITCPHCGGMVRVRARTRGDKTLEQAIEETKPPRRMPKMFREIFEDLFGKWR
jgi:DNA-directed RNA polymerase subunit RPC12/RpoP